MGNLQFTASINDTQFNKTLDEIEKKIKGVKTEAENGGSLFSISSLNDGYELIDTLKQIGDNIVKVRGEFRKWEGEFASILKSRAEANALMADVITMAGESPFELKDLAESTKELISFGANAKEAMADIQMLGDIALGTATPINALAQAYGNIREQGGPTEGDLAKLAASNIPIYYELAKILNTNTDGVKRFADEGKISFAQVQQAFMNMTNVGGIFNGVMQKESESLAGVISNFKNALDGMFNEMGKSQGGLVSSAVEGLTVLIQHYKELSTALGFLVTTYGIYKAASLVDNAIKKAEAIEYADIADGIDDEVSGLEKLIGLKVQRAQASASNAAAIAVETKAKAESAIAETNLLRAEVSSLAVKRQVTAETARAAAQEIAAAKLKLAAAESDFAARGTLSQARNVEVAQNAVLIASENGVAARKAASAAASEFNAAKTGLETSVKNASTLTTNANSAAEIANTVAKNADAIATTRLTAFQALQLAVTRQLAAAQAVYNASLLANPIVQVIAAVAALAGVIWYLYDGTTAEEKAQKSLNDTLEEGKKKREDLTSKSQSLIGEIQNETSSNVAKLKAYKELQAMFPDMLKNMTLQEFKTLSASEAQKKLNEAIDNYEINEFSKKISVANKNVEDAQKKLDNLLFSSNNSQFGGTGLTLPIANAREKLEQAKKEANSLTLEFQKQKALIEEANMPLDKKIKKLEEQKKSLEEQKKQAEAIIEKEKGMVIQGESITSIIASWSLKNLNNEIDNTSNKISVLKGELNLTPKDGGNFEHWSKIKSESEKSLKELSLVKKGGEDWNRYEAAIRRADKELEKYNLTSSKTEKKPPMGSLSFFEKEISRIQEALQNSNNLSSKQFEKLLHDKTEAERKAAEIRIKIEKNYADGSITYYEKIASAARESLSKISPLDTGKIEELLKKQTDADQKAEELRKGFSVKSFEETINEKKTKYELYDEWVSRYGKESADEQFKTLLESGKSYQEYLRNEISKIDAKLKAKKATEEDLRDLLILKARIEIDTSALEEFKKQISDALAKAPSETEKISLLNNEKFVVSSTVTDDTEKEAKLKALDQQIDEAQKRRHEELVSFMTAFIGSEEERTKIKKKYDDRRAALDAEYTDKQSEGYLQASEILKTNEEKELADNKAKTVLKSKEFEALTQKIKDASSEETKIVLEAERAKLQILKEKGGEKSAEYEAQLKAVKEAEKKHIEQSQKNWKSIADTVGALGNALKSAGGDTGELGGVLSGLSGEITNVQNTIQKAFSPEGFKPGLQDFASAVQSVISMISTIMESNRKRAEQEKKFAQERVGYEHQYEVALNKNIGQSYKKDGNMFMNDIEGKIKAGAAQYQDAQNKFQEAIGKLNEGKAKVSQKNVIDGQSAGKLIGQGASAGAIVGSLFGPLGTAIGAGVGAIVGGVASLFSKKKKDIYGGLLEQYPQLVKTGADGWKTINVDMAKALLANGQLDDNTKQLVQTALDYGDALEQSTQQMKEGILELTGKLGDSIRDSLVGAFKSGEDAAAAFSKTVGNVIADMTAKLLFSALFKENFNQLEKEMMDSYGALGDQSIIDDLTRFNKNIEGKPDEYVKGLEAANEMFEQMGFTDAFGKGGNPNSLSGSIKSITEETAGVLAGQMNAIRMTQATNLDVNRNQLLALTEIATNSRFLKHLERLETIEKKIGNNNGDIRAGGGF